MVLLYWQAGMRSGGHYSVTHPRALPLHLPLLSRSHWGGVCIPSCMNVFVRGEGLQPRCRLLQHWRYSCWGRICFLLFLVLLRDPCLSMNSFLLRISIAWLLAF